MRKIIENLDETKKMPVLFIGHGSPLNIILRNDFTGSLVRLGKNLPDPEAIMVISEKNEPLKFTYEGFQNGSISMRCFRSDKYFY